MIIRILILSKLTEKRNSPNIFMLIIEPEPGIKTYFSFKEDGIF